MQQTIAIIPARFNSKRFPGKVLANIAGKTLLQRTYERACRCALLSQIVIAVDDPRVAAHAQVLGATVIMTDPSHPSGTHRIAEAAKALDVGPTAIIVNVQADEPCLDPSTIDSLVACLLRKPEADVSTPITQITDFNEFMNPSVVKCVFDQEGKALYFSRAPIPYTQGKPCTAYRHLGLYCFRQPALMRFVEMRATPLQESEDLEQLKILEQGHTLHVCIVKEQGASVDTPEDVKKVEEQLCASISL